MPQPYVQRQEQKAGVFVVMGSLPVDGRRMRMEWQGQVGGQALIAAVASSAPLTADDVGEPPLLFEALWSAVRAGHRPLTEALLQRCADGQLDLNERSRDGGNTVAHIAARRDDPGMVAMLIRAGADPAALNGAGYIEWAARMEQGPIGNALSVQH